MLQMRLSCHGLIGPSAKVTSEKSRKWQTDVKTCNFLYTVNNGKRKKETIGTLLLKENQWRKQAENIFLWDKFIIYQTLFHLSVLKYLLKAFITKKQDEAFGLNSLHFL